MDMERFERLPLMGIVRGVSLQDMGKLAETAVEAGLRTMEITMNTPGAKELISLSREIAGDRMQIGAGTVLSSEDLDGALRSGASFIVMPSYIEEVVEACNDRGVAVFPGAFTPGEVLTSWRAGASMVKVFPSGMFGPRYIRELKGPYDRIKLMAVGGVRVDNIAEYFSSGADAVAFGSSVFRRDWLQRKDFGSIGALIAQYVSLVRDATGK
ncbi:MAG: bifunctional 4-hydroxy-2-oxoglutarate aldolase/2-dehydro-3-deoxy-phosphogluconate aldolase [Candidatus Omnitrophica bacterium]|nr:bifunctional 4-hydroxy-2-oxoglutarate aldolase/2-dehydro-3-deoxy-phosphogluconate aldolase [Candidatus Omnitrophota bacterium]